MLADDPDEAQEQAELLLKERSLSAYYDEGALKGLQLAANDAARGVLGSDKLDGIKHGIRSLVTDLAAHDDRDPDPEEKAETSAKASKSEKDVPKPAAPQGAPERDRPTQGRRGPAPVLCLAGRGPLDGAAFIILAQLTGEHGPSARVLPHEAASREAIATLDGEGVAIVCTRWRSSAEVPPTSTT